MENSERN